MAQERRLVIGGVDTHKDVHVGAVIDDRGKILDTAEFETTAKGYRLLVEWMVGFGELQRVGVEGTGAYGASHPERHPVRRNSTIAGPIVSLG
jgi:transposase